MKGGYAIFIGGNLKNRPAVSKGKIKRRKPQVVSQ